MGEARVRAQRESNVPRWVPSVDGTIIYLYVGDAYEGACRAIKDGEATRWEAWQAGASNEEVMKFDTKKEAKAVLLCLVKMS